MSTKKTFIWGADRTREFLALFEKGYTDRQLMKHFNVPLGVVQSKRYRMALHRNAVTRAIVDARDAYITDNAGKKSVEEMMADLGLSRPTIYKLLRERNVAPVGKSVVKRNRYRKYILSNIGKKTAKEMAADLGLKKESVYVILRKYKKGAKK